MIIVVMVEGGGAEGRNDGAGSGDSDGDGGGNSGGDYHQLPL